MSNTEVSRKKATRVPMREQDPERRARNFSEVPHGYSEQEAMEEAKRCLQCKKPLCVDGCPVNVKIPEFIKLIADGKFAEAARKLKETNALPAVCGRVCPQEEQCEIRCILQKKGNAIAVGNLERFAADWERDHNAVKLPEIKPSNGKKVAIVGSGPAGLTCAGELIKEGFDVTIFEALHEAGGVLVYGIPEFRLPKEIVKQEIDYLTKLGVKIEKNFIIGKIATIDELLTEEGFDAVFVGSGAGLPSFMKIKGENSIGVYSANEYLTRSNLMKAFEKNSPTPIMKGKKVVTVGGGNVAMDAARTAIRLGAENSSIVYRRSESEMPARVAEVHHAKEEGIEFNLLCNPVEILSDDKGFVKGIKCIRMELGEPDASGRRRPVPIDGSEFMIDCEVVVIAIGNSPNPLIPESTPELEISKWGTIVADETTGQTSKKYVYAGGDIVTGAATVILAMGAGKIAAENICKDLRDQKQ
ncbi:NADPH-dependent glutamate synthase [Chitinispirillales bacterium ANBcel5]|uniref:NADPH-dependent glutamate synthase n=1 Tax=Cellulosispirillum alkaliphilum TaxID=3039283 RepID=UPI002A546B26|nr:NADPH-dependent glutamate synthase [Chitinispirillales bacterium ANBcel5]